MHANASRAFNALDYGAVGDDRTDNTEAFSACLAAVIGAGGGEGCNCRRESIAAGSRYRPSRRRAGSS